MKRRAADLLRKARKLARIVQVPAYRGALRHGVAATVEHERVPFASDVKTVLDLGGSVGQFSVFARHRFPTAEIRCYEPLPESITTARRALGGSPRIQLQQVAVGANRGRALIHVSADSHSSSLLPQTTEQAHRFPGTGEVDTIDVEVRTLDELAVDIEGPVLLKIDLQGGELDALKGGDSILERVTEIYVESSFVELYSGQPLADELIDYLRFRGFSLRGVYSVVYGDDGACVQADLLFVREWTTP